MPTAAARGETRRVPGAGRGYRLRSFLGSLVRNRLAVVAAVFLVGIHLAAIGAPLLTPYSPEQIDPINALTGPTEEHPLGADELGRDVLARLLYGARISLAVGMLAVTLSVGIGTVVGALSGYFGGVTDAVLMRITDAMMSIPQFFILLAILAVFGGTTTAIIVVIGITSWMSIARVVRSEFIRWRNEVFVEAAVAIGIPPRRIVARHLLPHAVPSIIVAATLGVGFSILIESAVSFLGLGIQPPTPTWGNMLMNAQQYVWTEPALAVYPGVLILLTVLSYNFLGDGLRDALDPRLRGR